MNRQVNSNQSNVSLIYHLGCTVGLQGDS